MFGKVPLTWHKFGHSEMLQFINFSASGQSRKKEYAGSGHDCSKLSKENQESVTVQPFSNFAGGLTVVQVIFADAGMATHMCPENAVEKISNLVSVNESGCTTGDTLFAANNKLSTITATKREEKGKEDYPNVVIADGHKSRFDAHVLRHCKEHTLD